MAQRPQLASDKTADRHILGCDLTGRVDVQQNTLPLFSGGFANIYAGFYNEALKAPDKRLLGFFSKEKSMKVAVKAYYFTKSRDSEDKFGDAVKAFIHEATIWTLLSHQHITPFLGYCSVPSKSPVPSLISPFYENGNINIYLSKRGRDDNAHVLKLIVQTAAGLVYMHNRSQVIVHGDIKGANILIDNDCNARIADFGLSRISDPKTTAAGCSNGSCRWMAPELLESYNTVTMDSDVWALGMTILEILSGKCPFENHKNPISVVVALNKGVKPERPSCPSITETVWALLQRTWDRDPKARPSVHAVGLVLELLYISELRSKAGFKFPRLSPEQAQDILKTVAARNPAHTSSSAGAPYGCKWPDCSRSFASLEDCCAHECEFHDNAPPSMEDFFSAVAAATVTRSEPVGVPTREFTWWRPFELLFLLHSWSWLSLSLFQWERFRLLGKVVATSRARAA